MELIKVKNEDIKDLAKLTDEIWHEYWPCILSAEQIDYMVEKFQSENAIFNQIKNENYTYYFIIFMPQLPVLLPYSLEVSNSE